MPADRSWHLALTAQEMQVWNNTWNVESGGSRPMLRVWRGESMRGFEFDLKFRISCEEFQVESDRGG